MATIFKTTARFLLLGFFSFGSTLGNTVSVSSQTGKVDQALEITCLLNPTSGAIIGSVKWFLGSDTNGIQRSAATCNLIGLAPSYDLNRYSFTCSSSSNTFTLKILAPKSSDDGQCWSCSVTFSNFPETDKASACIKVNVTTSTSTTTQSSATGTNTKQDALPVSLIIGVCVGGFIFILIIIIIICCCCQCCCLYHSCWKKENKHKCGENFDEINNKL